MSEISSKADTVLFWCGWTYMTIGMAILGFYIAKKW